MTHIKLTRRRVTVTGLPPQLADGRAALFDTEGPVRPLQRGAMSHAGDRRSRNLFRLDCLDDGATPLPMRGTHSLTFTALS